MEKRYGIDNRDQAAALDRRRLVRDVGLAVLAVQVLPLVARAAAPCHGAKAPDNLIVHSTPGLLSHTHDLAIPSPVLSNPPRQGVSLTSTKALFHTHDIALTQNQLMAISHGGTVTVRRSSHLFVIAMASGGHRLSS